jgi:HEAT repeat protein
VKRPAAKTKAKPKAKAATAAARSKPKAKGSAARSKPKAKAGAPDLAWLIGPGSKKLRALLRKPDHAKIRDLLNEAGVFGPRQTPVVHPDTTRALAPPLIAALDDSAEIVRANAAWLLGQLGPREACAPLARVVAGDASVNVRRWAADALGWLVPPGAAAVPALVAALAHPGNHMYDSGLRHAAAGALARHRPLAAEHAPAALRALELEYPTYERRGDLTVPTEAPDWHLAQQLAPVLAGMGTAAMPALRDALASRRRGVRALAVAALCRLIARGEVVAAPELASPLAALVEDEVETVRAHAAVALAALEPARAATLLRPLGEALAAEGMSWTARLQLVAIVRGLGPAAMPLFPRLQAEPMHPGGRQIRRLLLAALGLAARDRMAAAVKRGKVPPAEMALWLAQVGAPDAFERLDDIDPGEPGTGATDTNLARHRLLARTGPRGVAAVRALLADPDADPQLAAEAIRGLRAAGAAARDDLLAAGLAAPSAGVRAMAAAQALAAGNARAGEVLERLWPEHDELVMDAIATMRAPATAFVDRLIALFEARRYRYGASKALAVVAAALPDGPSRARALAALADAYGSRDSRQEADAALARAGLARGLEDPGAAPAPDDDDEL